mmetsp:Transcript_12374/g.23707  ORF Transcript_12374/g.23707 Transcript_12374/m.23707 type:complete len:383 (-) Transcript_12374:385-1533(-)
MKDAKRPTTAQVLCAITAYVLTSSTLVYSNKFLMSPEISIPAPMLVTWFQCIITVVMIRVLCAVRRLLRRATVEKDDDDGHNNTKIDACTQIILDQLPKKSYSYERKYGWSTISMSFAFVLMISFTNICLKFVEVSFYQVARGLTPVINSVLSFLLLGITTSYRTAACLLVILSGYYLGVQGEIKFSAKGTFFGFTSSVLCVLYPILTRKQMDMLNDKWAVIFYNNVHASLMFLPLIAVFEAEIIKDHMDKIYNPLFWFWMLVAALLGSFVGIAAVTQLKLTSPLSHNVIGNAKGAAQSVLGAYIWRTPLTSKGVTGLMTVLGGSLLYAYTRMGEQHNPAKGEKGNGSNDKEGISCFRFLFRTRKSEGGMKKTDNDEVQELE